MDGVEFQVLPAVSKDPLRGLPPPPTAESEESNEPAAKEKSQPRRARSAGGTVTKKSGTFVRMKPAKADSSKPGS